MDSVQGWDTGYEAAGKYILKEKYTNYSEALGILKLEPLNERRVWLLLKYGKQCTQLEQTRDLFPLKHKPHVMLTRNSEKYEVTNANTNRYYNSTVAYLQRLLNKEELKKRLPG